MGRTSRGPGTCWSFSLEVNAVKGISATAAVQIQVPVASSKMAFGYLIVDQAMAGMEAMARLTAGVHPGGDKDAGTGFDGSGDQGMVVER
jgi:hypothetical protein